MPKWWSKHRAPKDRPQLAQPTRSADSSNAPMREFVYLDDVSVRSLLASQKGALTDQVTDLLSKADEAELAGTIGASAPVAKAEFHSRYQSTATQETQTSRKAVAQSLFKELRELIGLDIALTPAGDATDASPVEELVDERLAIASVNLRRGMLIEVEVELVADPIFRFSTIAAELSEMMRDFPEILNQPGTKDGLAILVPGNRLLQRFLAGLIPLRARSTSHEVISLEGLDHVVPAGQAVRLGIDSSPLIIVGVTEQASYWRDVRRVLFSGSRFTMLCRVSRDGLWPTWEPVKLAEVLKEVLPDFPDQIADVGRIGLHASQAATRSTPPPIASALGGFITRIESAGVPGLTPEGLDAARQVAFTTAVSLPETVTGQNEGFGLVTQALKEHGCDLSPDQWQEHVREARSGAGLPLFASPEGPASQPGPSASSLGSNDRLLDTEIIAIYW